MPPFGNIKDFRFVVDGKLYSLSITKYLLFTISTEILSVINLEKLKYYHINNRRGMNFNNSNQTSPIACQEIDDIPPYSMIALTEEYSLMYFGCIILELNQRRSWFPPQYQLCIDIVINSYLTPLPNIVWIHQQLNFDFDLHDPCKQFIPVFDFLAMNGFKLLVGYDRCCYGEDVILWKTVEHRYIRLNSCQHVEYKRRCAKQYCGEH